MPPDTPPAVLLLRPQLGENIGAAARAMSNFGLSELRLIVPRDGWPNAKAVEMAAGGQEIVESAELYPDLSTAFTGLQRIYATAGYLRDMEKRVLTPRQAAGEMRALSRQGQKIGILLGPERAGLSNEEMAHADALIAIPADARNPSLNLAQALVIFAYEWWISAESAPIVPLTAEAFPAPREELEGFFAHLEEVLDGANYFRTLEKKPVMWRSLLNIFTRTPLSSQEVRTLRGMLRSLTRSRLSDEKP